MIWQDKVMREFYLKNRLSLAFYSNCVLGLKTQKINFISNLPNLDAVCRSPGLEIDQEIRTPNSQHIAVACFGQIYITDINTNLEALIQDAKRFPREPEVGWLTCLPRDLLAEKIKLLDAKNLNLIQTARFWVSLDIETAPEDLNSLAFNLAYGNLGNRWFDQSKQIILFQDGRIGLNFDHLEFDGESAMAYLGHIRVPTGEGEFKKLSWGNSKKLQQAIQEAQKYVSEELSKREILCFETRELNSDLEIQLAIQKAITKIFGKNKITSEAVSMGHMPNGRYNTVYFSSPEDVFKTHRDKIKRAKLGEVFADPGCDVSTSSGGNHPELSVFGFTDTSPNIIGIAYWHKPGATLFHVKCDGVYFGFAKKIKSLLLSSSG